MRMPWRTFWMKPKPEDDIYDLFEIELSGDEGIETLETKIGYSANCIETA